MRTSFDNVGPRSAATRWNRRAPDENVTAGWARPLRDSGLPEDTHLTWAGAWMVKIDTASAASPTPQIQLSVRPTDEGCGTPLYWVRSGSTMWAYFGAHHPAAIAPAAMSAEWSARIFNDPTLARQLPGVFGLVVIDASTRRVFVAADRLGVQSVHYHRSATGTIHISTHLMWLLQATGHGGDVSESSFLTHLGFGYPVAPDDQVYTGVHKLPSAGYLRAGGGQVTVGRYWSDEERTSEANGTDVAAIAKALAEATASTGPGIERCIGLTAGRDSLCLASVTPRQERPLSATFGARRSADRLQAGELATALGWPHVSRSLCGPREFARWAAEIACHSAGLATTSYVDMAAFVNECVPPGHALVMGEGGECVRDFFHAGGNGDLLRTRYMTEGIHLERTLAPEFAARLAEYPDNLLAATRRHSNQSDEAFELWFYRSQRMPGNFAQRHTVLSAFRPKVSPFLDARFIDLAYQIDRNWYARSALHRAIIEAARPDLLPFFDSPLTATVETQDWSRRFSTSIGPVVYQLLDDSLPFCRDVFRIDHVRTLCRETIARPSRAMYYLFRVLSFALARLALRSTTAASRENVVPSEVRGFLDHPELVFVPPALSPVS